MECKLARILSSSETVPLPLAWPHKVAACKEQATSHSATDTGFGPCKGAAHTNPATPQGAIDTALQALMRTMTQGASSSSTRLPPVMPLVGATGHSPDDEVLTSQLQQTGACAAQDAQPAAECQGCNATSVT